MMKLQWSGEPPEFIKSAAAQCLRGDLVHHSLWPQHGAIQKVCFGESLEGSSLVSLLLNDGVHSLVQYNSEWFTNDLEATVHLREQNACYFSQPGQTLLGGADSTMEWVCQSRSQKLEVKEELLHAAKADSEALRNSLGLIFEELFMNAFIDAPREAARRRSVQGLVPQAVAVRPVTISLVRRADRLCLSCTDLHGTLIISKFLGRMKQVYDRGAGEVINLNPERGGAGLGCVLLFENCSTLALGVSKDRQTTVSCVIPANLNHRQNSAVQKSFHLIEVAEE